MQSVPFTRRLPVVLHLALHLALHWIFAILRCRYNQRANKAGLSPAHATALEGNMMIKIAQGKFHTEITSLKLLKYAST